MWLLDQIDNGISVLEIAEKLHVKEKAVQSRLNAHKLGFRLGFIKNHDDIRHEYEDASTENLAKKYKVCPESIRKFFIDHGIKLKIAGSFQSKSYDFDYVISLFKNGKSLRDISKIININEDKLSIDLRKNGVNTRRFYYGKSPDIDISTIINEYNSGKSSYNIANNNNCSWSTIIRRLRNEKIKIRKSSDTLKISIPKNELVRLVNDKISVYEMMIIYSCSYETIRQRLLDFDLKAKSHNRSKEEIELYNYIKNTNNNALHNIKIGDKYPDIIINNLIIEYNGGYWHSSLFQDKNHIENRINYFKKMGYETIIIWDFYNKSAVKSLIKNKISNNSNKIYARKCAVKKISTIVAEKFCKQWHIQGHINSTVYYSLVYNGDVVGIMSFVYKQNIWEVNRLCYKHNTTVVGGSKKLFVNFLKDKKPSIVTSYSDMSLFSGKIYESLGFIKKYETQPSYLYYKNGKTLSRQQCQKHKLVKAGHDEFLTENQIMSSLGYVRVYTSKQAIWQYTNKSVK